MIQQLGVRTRWLSDSRIRIWPLFHSPFSSLGSCFLFLFFSRLAVARRFSSKARMDFIFCVIFVVRSKIASCSDASISCMWSLSQAQYAGLIVWLCTVNFQLLNAVGNFGSNLIQFMPLIPCHHYNNHHSLTVQLTYRSRTHTWWFKT